MTEKSNSEISALVRGSLETHFPLYEDSHIVNVFNKGSLLIGYRRKNYSARDREMRDQLIFNLEIKDCKCDLLDIGIESEHRGKGLGWKLYESVHDVAKVLGLDYVLTTPSGGYNPDNKGGYEKTRKQYLLERGYEEFDKNKVILHLR